MISDEVKKQHEEERGREEDDPVVLMRGVGKQLWEAECGDHFIERIRSEDPPVSPTAVKGERAAQNLSETVWQRIESHQGKAFRTVTGLPFVYQVEGAGIWFSRGGRRINRK